MGNIRNTRSRPEAKIQLAIREYLAVRGWYSKPTHGSIYQSGFPDLYCFHPKFRERWIDCKTPGAYTFTREQKRLWPAWDTFGIGIWILTAADQPEYDKLFAPPNWRSYWKPSWKLPTPEEMDAIIREISLTD